MMTDINTSIHIHIHAQLYIYNTFLSVSISQIFSKDFGQLTAVEKIHRKHHAIGLNLKLYIYKAIFYHTTRIKIQMIRKLTYCKHSFNDTYNH